VRSDSGTASIPSSNFSRLCWLVLIELALTILIFYGFTKYFE
jgi:hypothetical protein